MLFLGGISTQIFPFEHVEFVEKLSKMSCSRKTPWEFFLKVVFFSLLRNQLKGISCCSVFPDSRLLGALNPVTVVLLLIIVSAQTDKLEEKYSVSDVKRNRYSCVDSVAIKHMLAFNSLRVSILRDLFFFTFKLMTRGEQKWIEFSC